MKGFIRPATLLFTLLLCTGVRAQHHIGSALLDKLPVTILPAQDNDRLLREEADKRKPGRADVFAVTIPTSIRPENSGTWIERNGTSSWYYRLRSVSAKTLNLGFSEYHLPAGAELYLTTEKEELGPFTPADNADHNELWTPVLKGDELMIELRVPTVSKGKVQLYLTSVNHDFKDVTNSLSGSCNLDVICGAEDGWGIIDNYRDIIRSVAGYTLRGVNQCTGFLVNNANQDGIPYFMTANHCRVTPDSDQSVVTYWNYESDVCRQPGSPESAQTDVGSRAIFNSGVEYLASSANSDMCLTRLEEPVNPLANAFYAGWSLDPTVPLDTVIAIHHPRVHEKRISFSFKPVTRTGIPPLAEDLNGRFLVIDSWDIGTTEGGSSGSPLFDKNNRVRGQLWRGAASCTFTSGYDQYGFFTASWEGDGTPDSRLKDWLDPCGTGITEMDGFDASSLGATLVAQSNCAENCITASSTFFVEAGPDFAPNSAVSILSSTAGINPVLSRTTVNAGETISVAVPGDAGLAGGDYEIVVRVAGQGVSDDITLYLNLTATVLDAPELLGPAEDTDAVSPIATFNWSLDPEAINYDFQLSLSEDFNTLISNQEELEEAPLTLDRALDANTRYYWRVRSVNLCGKGAWATSSFRVIDQQCGVARAVDTPVTISPTGRDSVVSTVEVTEDFPIAEMQVYVKIDHSFIGDLSAFLIAPDGRVVELFAAPINGSCGGTNIEVLLRDNTVLTNTDFASTCTGNAISIQGAFQPLDPFDIFAGESAQGTWTLVVEDGADIDGGRIVDFAIDYCGDGAIIPDFTARPANPTWVSCLEDGADFTLELGPSYDETTTFVITTPTSALTEFSSTLDIASRIANLSFSGWNGLTRGTHRVSIELISGAGFSRVIEVPLILDQMADAADLLNPVNEESLPSGSPVTFSWVRAPGADSYTLEYSTDPTFTTVDGRLETLNTEETISTLPTGAPIYWRVISNNEACGTGVSGTNSFTIAGTAVEEFGGGRSISIYPNPVSGQLTIELIGGWSETVTGHLFDATGRRLQAYGFSGTGRKQFDVSTLAQGMYFLRVQAGERSYTERIVVSH